MTNGSLMKVESIAESILQYLRPVLNDNCSWKPILVIFRVAILHMFYCTYSGRQVIKKST